MNLTHRCSSWNARSPEGDLPSQERAWAEFWGVLDYFRVLVAAPAGGAADFDTPLTGLLAPEEAAPEEDELLFVGGASPLFGRNLGCSIPAG